MAKTIVHFARPGNSITVSTCRGELQTGHNCTTDPAAVTCGSCRRTLLFQREIGINLAVIHFAQSNMDPEVTGRLAPGWFACNKAAFPDSRGTVDPNKVTCKACMATRVYRENTDWQALPAERLFKRSESFRVSRTGPRHGLLNISLGPMTSDEMEVAADAAQEQLEHWLKPGNAPNPLKLEHPKD